MKSRLSYKALLLTALLLGLHCLLQAAVPSRPQPPRLVNDFCSVFAQDFADSLEMVLVSFDENTSNQLCIVTVPDLDGQEVAQYALSLANLWGIGSTRNNGILILLKPRGSDGYVDITIQIGRGLEGAVPDAYASRIIRNIMGPHLKMDEYQEAVSKACAELMALSSGEISEPRDDEEITPVELVLISIFSLVIFCILVYVISKSNKNGGSHTGSSGGRGGGSPFIFFGPGHSSGGFGSSSGSFGGFRGFGGGSFGGGGASGRF